MTSSIRRYLSEQSNTRRGGNPGPVRQFLGGSDALHPPGARVIAHASNRVKFLSNQMHAINHVKCTSNSKGGGGLTALSTCLTPPSGPSALS